MDSFEKVTWARKVLDIPEHATLALVKQNYKMLQKKWHPDLCQDESTQSQEMTVNLNKAYGIIIAYIEQYRFSFAKEEARKYCSDEEWWNNRFGGDPIWSGSGS